MVREPWTAIPKDLTTRCDIKRFDVYSNWCNSIRLGGQALAGDLPVYNQFYQMYPTSSIRVHTQELLPLMETGFYRLAIGLRKNQFEEHISPSTRVSFFKAFGITPPEQRSLELRFKAFG